jgi:hypothetical protein
MDVWGWQRLDRWLQVRVLGVAAILTRPPEPAATDTPENDETPDRAGASGDGRGWFRTSDLSRVKRALSH